MVPNHLHLSIFFQDHRSRPPHHLRRARLFPRLEDPRLQDGFRMQRSRKHAYFSYIHKDDFTEVECEAVFQNFLDALLQVTTKLEDVTLQTSGKHYNVHLRPVESPAREEMPRVTPPIGNFYF